MTGMTAEQEKIVFLQTELGQIGKISRDREIKIYYLENENKILKNHIEKLEIELSKAKTRIYQLAMQEKI